MASVRCFTGIPLDECLGDSLRSAVDIIKDRDRTWRDEKWVAPSNLHVTLHFLGSIEETDLPALFDALDTALAFERFVMPLAGITAVPGSKRCRMLWATFLDPDGACASMAESIQRAALPFGVPAEDRPFKPHATLCRARRPKAIDAAALDDANASLTGGPRKMSVGRATLFASRLSPRGPVYTALRDWHARGE